jgi:GntR family transcriptional regulator, transcriptional repressor for pyruvate dehydrogenase complex
VILQSADASTVIAQDLITLIRTQGLAPGDRLPSIRQISARLGARPHQVRDALLHVQALGYVRVPPRARAVVQKMGDRPEVLPAGEVEPSLDQTEHHLFHLLEVRQLLEIETVQQAARRRRVEDLLPVRGALDAMNAVGDSGRRPEYVEHDIEFHLAIAALAGNPVLTTMLKSVLARLRPLLCRLPFEDECRESTQRSHAEIYRALVSGNGEAARLQMHDHLQLAYENLLGEVQSLPD